MKASRRPSTRLALLFPILTGLFIVAFSGPARADQVLDSDRSALVASTSAEQFALMGGVFLILGGAFVFAPQIVSGVNGFLARLFGRPRKTVAKATEPDPAAGQAQRLAPPGAEHEQQAPADAESEWAPPPEPEPAPGEAVSRLRDEISSAWGRKADP